jgi:hypothetical protein
MVAVQEWRLNMNIKAYINPDFTWDKKLIFFVITTAAIGISLGLIYIVSMMVLDRDLSGRAKVRALRGAFVDKSQRLFEMLIAGTSVMSFSCSYVILNHLYALVQSGVAKHLNHYEKMMIQMWTDGKDFVLLLLILMSCVFNTVLDSLIIPLKKITKEEKATIRMMAMFYVIIILMYLNIIGDESQYSPVMMYYFGLMIGRFIYFDASFKDFLVALKNMFFNSPYLLLTIILTYTLATLGFKMSFLLERNYFIVGVFYTHLFMLAVVFIIHTIWMIRDGIRNRKSDIDGD